MNLTDFPWHAHQIEQLRDEWVRGNSTSLIGRNLGCTKNAVVGKAHRIGLPSRASPIAGRSLQPRPPVAAPKPRGVRTLPPMASLVDEVDDAPPEPVGVREKPVAPPVEVEPLPQRPPSPNGCQYITGDPGRTPYRFCAAPTPLGESWCLECKKSVFQRRTDRREFVDYRMGGVR